MSASPLATVLIAGAGTIGLAVAALLARGRAGGRIHVRVLEARGAPRWRPDAMDLRVYALSRASQQLFEDLGLWRQVLDARACPYRRMHVFEGGSADVATAIDFDAADIGEPDLGHIVEDSLLRQSLLELLASAPNVEIANGAVVEGVEVGLRSVEVQLAQGGKAHGAVLLAADGSESVVRRLRALPVSQRGYGQTAVVTHVATELPHRHTAWQRFLPGGPLAFLPLVDGRSSIVWSVPSVEAEALLAASEEAFIARLQTASADMLGRLELTARRAAFALQSLHALKYCEPRIALVGDAAHTVHPLAGQGMNLGLLDAAAIAGVLEAAALAGEDIGDRKVLRRYERERKGDNLAMLLAFDALNRMFRLPGPAVLLRGFGMAAVDRAPLAKRLLMRQALRLNARSKNRLGWSHA